MYEGEKAQKQMRADENGKSNYGIVFLHVSVFDGKRPNQGTERADEHSVFKCAPTKGKLMEYHFCVGTNKKK